MAEQHNESKTPQVTPTSPTQAPLARGPVQQKSTRPHVQLRRGLQMMGFAQQAALLDPNPVQRKGGENTDQVHQAAAEGIASGGGALPHAQQIQGAFGSHDISGIQAHTGASAQRANQAMGAEAYATGNHVAFGGAPDLHTTAHEAAHVIQQQHGVSLSGGVGAVGDKYENHADKVADAVVKGESAEPILNEMTGGGASGGTQQKAVQNKAVQMEAVQRTTPLTTPPPPPTPPTPPAPVLYTSASAKSAIDTAAPDVADISTPHVPALVGKDETHFNTTYADKSLLRHHVIKAYIASGAAQATTQAVGSKDPIAVQKFADIDAEAHLDPAHSGLKATFYTNLAAEMSKSTYSDRARSYNALKAAGPPWVFAFKGVQIPPDRISPLSARNQSVDRLYSIITAATKTQIDSAIEAPLVAARAQPATIAARKADEALRKKAYRHLLSSGTAPMTTIDVNNNISDYPTWYAPGAITVNPSAAANTEFSRLMTLGALQPEWYPNGTVVLNVTQAVGKVRECRKPTAFDGLMSALWTARNVGAADYGVTGGGLPEFLEGNLKYTEVSSANAVIPSDDFLTDMQRVTTQVTNALGVDGRNNPLSTPTEERLRGSGHTSIMNTSPEVGGMYGNIIGRSTTEQRSPSGPVMAPGATTPVGTQVPRAPAVAPGGVYGR